MALMTHNTRANNPSIKTQFFYIQFHMPTTKKNSIAIFARSSTSHRLQTSVDSEFAPLKNFPHLPRQCIQPPGKPIEPTRDPNPTQKTSQLDRDTGKRKTRGENALESFPKVARVKYVRALLSMRKYI